MKIIISVIVLLVLGAAYYFLFGGRAVTTVQAPTQNSAAGTVPAQGVVPENQVPDATGAVNIGIMDFSFNPVSVTVVKGTKVTWTNKDSMSHTVTSDQGTTLDSQALATGESYSVTFLNPGTYTYHCKIHPSMKGTITVTE